MSSWLSTLLTKSPYTGPCRPRWELYKGSLQILSHAHLAPTDERPGYKLGKDWNKGEAIVTGVGHTAFSDSEASWENALDATRRREGGW